MLNIFGDEEEKVFGYTMSTVNPFTSVATLETHCRQREEI